MDYKHVITLETKICSCDECKERYPHIFNNQPEPSKSFIKCKACDDDKFVKENPDVLVNLRAEAHTYQTGCSKREDSINITNVETNPNEFPTVKYDKDMLKTLS